MCKSDEEALEFMDEYGFTADQAALLETHKRFSEAAEVHAQEHNFSQAIRLELLGESSQERERRACGHVLTGFWLTISLGVSPALSEPTCQELFEFSDKLNLAALDDFDRDQVSIS